VDASVRRFLVFTALIGLVILGIVLWVAAITSRRVTQPILTLREATRRLQEGGESPPLAIHTQDELQDLAEDFTTMASALRHHRRGLENMVAQRTHALETTRSELAQVVKHAADAIIGLDGENRVRLWNEGAQELFGYTAAEAEGRTITSLIGTGDSAESHEAETIERRLNEGRAVSLRTTRRPKRGDPFPVSLTQAPVSDDEGRRAGSSLVIRDDRAQSRLEDHMRRSERLAAVSVMAAGLAHEINNPLAVIGNRIELMQRSGGADSEVAGDLVVLGEQVARLRGLTGDLLEFAREEDSPVPVSIEQAVERVAALLEQTFVSNGVRLELEVRGSPVAVPGNEKAIETVAMNLLMNAAQATPPGGRVGAVVVGPTEGPFVRLVVEDTGPGIPASLGSRVFEPFFSGRDSTGLGLTVCRTIMERHGGRLWIDDAYTNGTRFVAEFAVHG
jgi:PAS domain S-box-containing protein